MGNNLSFLAIHLIVMEPVSASFDEQTVNVTKYRIYSLYVCRWWIGGIDKMDALGCRTYSAVSRKSILRIGLPATSGDPPSTGDGPGCSYAGEHLLWLWKCDISYNSSI